MGRATAGASAGTDSRVAARAAAIASLGAAVIHAAVAPAHWGHWPASGIFFAVTALCQFGWAVLVWRRPAPALFAFGIAANAGLAVLWVWSHLAGEPFGPNAGETEAVQAAGICALLLECYVVMGAAWSWLRSDRPGPVSAVGGALVLLGANAIVAAAVTAGLVSTLVGDHHHHGNAEAGDHVRRVTVLDVRAPAPAAPDPAPEAPDGHAGHHHEG